MKIIISGGGTGGHVFPAISIANALRKIQPNCEILFVGAKGRLEMEKVPAAGYPIEGLWISGFQRSLSFQNLLFPLKVASSLVKSYQIIRRFKPDAVAGVGGYASGPLLQVASAMNIPALIQEQNSYPGITNRMLAGKVQKICVAYKEVARWFPAEKIILTGNPVREGIINKATNKAEALAHFGLQPNKKTLFVTGGSLGARGINEAVAANLSKFVAADLQIIWQTGKFYVDWARPKAQLYTQNVKCLPFIDRMDLAYCAADVILSRAGAGSIAELCIVGKPTILMPSPFVAEDHQTANAKSLADADAALMLRDNEAPEKLFDQVNNLINDTQKINTLVQNMQSLAVTDAADQIAQILCDLALKK